MNGIKTARSRQFLLGYALTLPTSEGLQPNNDSLAGSIASEEETPSDTVIANLLNTYTSKKCIKTSDTTLFLTKLSFTLNGSNGGKKSKINGTSKKDVFDGRIESYNLGKEMGRGSYAVVRKCTHNAIPNKEFAIKIYEKKKGFTARKRRGVMHEIQILKTLNNPNIVRLFETIEDSNNLYLVFEGVEGGSLCDYLRRVPSNKLPEPEAKRLFSQIVNAIQYCHSKNVVHRDIKLENILLDGNKNVKVIDFGFSVVVNTVCKLSMFCGTALYIAPEIISRKSYWGPPVDVWSLGVILYVMLSGKFPFKGNSESELYKSISRGVYTVPKGISESASKLLANLLNTNPFKRPTCDELMKDPFLEIKPTEITMIPIKSTNEIL